MKKKKYNKQIKWHDATKFVPDNDRSVLLYIRNTKDLYVSTEKGAYIDNAFFSRSPILQQRQKVVRWCEIPAFEENKTSAEWSKIYDRPDNVKSGDLLLSEKAYISQAVEF